jgi:WD40 repeat protein
VKFSPDGRTLAFGSYDDTVRLFNMANPAKPSAIGSPLTEPTGPVEMVAFNRDGSLLASGSDDDTIQLWNVKNPARPQSLGPSLTGHTGFVYSVEFSPLGNVLASASADETVRLWNLNINYAIRRICSIAGNDFSPQQWRQYTQLSYQHPCYRD